VSRADLAAALSALVAALVASAPVPAGFDERLVARQPRRCGASAPGRSPPPGRAAGV
jgi:hypothetical protein